MEARYFDAGVRTQHADELRAKLVDAVAPAHRAQARLLAASVLEAFDKDLRLGLVDAPRSFSEVSRGAVAGALRDFDARAGELDVPGSGLAGARGGEPGRGRCAAAPCCASAMCCAPRACACACCKAACLRLSCRLRPPLHLPLRLHATCLLSRHAPHRPCALHAVDDARASLATQLDEAVDKAKHARTKEALHATEATLSKLIAVPAVELLSAFPPNLWQQLHTVRKQVRAAGTARPPGCRRRCAVAPATAALLLLLLAAARLQRSHHSASSPASCFSLAHARLHMNCVARALRCGQAVASASSELSSSLEGVELSEAEAGGLSAKLNAAADKKLGDLLQVRARAAGSSALHRARSERTCSAYVAAATVTPHLSRSRSHALSAH